MDISRIRDAKGDTPAWQVGLATAGVGAAMSFTPSMLPRVAGAPLREVVAAGSPMKMLGALGQQRQVGLGMAALGLGAGVLGEKTVDLVDGVLPGGTETARGATMLGAAILPAIAAFAPGRPNLKLVGAALASGGIGMGALTGGAVDAGRFVLDALGLDTDSGRGTAATSLAILGVAGAAVATKGRVTAEARAMPFHVEPPAPLVPGAPTAMEHGPAWTQPLDEAGRLFTLQEPKPGSGAVQLTDTQGVRFRETVTRRPEWETPARRIFVPENASDPTGAIQARSLTEYTEGQAKLAVDEAANIGHFDDPGAIKSEFFGSTTGSGFLPRHALSVYEHLSGGGSTAVAMQYSTKRSVEAFKEIDEAVDLMLATPRAFSERWRAQGMEPPKQLLFGESLGSSALEIATLKQGLQPHQRALLVGRPSLFADLSTKQLAKAGIDPSEVLVMNDIEQLRSLTPEQLDAVRVFVFRKPNDPVAWGDAPLLVRKPDGWPDGPSGKGLGWRPVSTGLHTFADLYKATNYKITPGSITNKGPHDYRDVHADLIGALMSKLDAGPATPEQVVAARTQSLADEVAYPNADKVT